MKNIVVFVLLSIAFFSCRENQVASEQMDRAETLLPVYPDSAYVILERTAVRPLVHAVLPGGRQTI